MVVAVAATGGKFCKFFCLKGQAYSSYLAFLVALFCLEAFSAVAAADVKFCEYKFSSSFLIAASQHCLRKG